MSEDKNIYKGYTEYLENRIKELEGKVKQQEKPVSKKRVRRESVQTEHHQVLLNE